MAASAIDLAELEQELTRTRALFEQWSMEVLSEAQNCKALHVARLRDSKGEMAALTERLQRAEKQAAQVRQQVAQDAEHEQALQATADSLLAEQHVLQRRLAQMRRDAAADADAVRRLEGDVAADRAELDVRVAKLDQLRDAYAGALGLRLVPQPRDGELLLQFSHVDRADPARLFSFAVVVLGKETYKVTRCEPELQERAALEQELLGKRGDFAGFVRAMRRAFVQLAEREAAAAGGQQQQ